MLDIRLFGTPIILYNGQPQEIQRKATRALLYYLAATGQPVGRARLATFFWPEETDEKARSRLRDQLGKLRDALPDSSLLQTTPQSASLDFTRTSVDLLTFQKLREQVNRTAWNLPPSATMPLAIYKVLVDLAEMWNGPGFIAGVDVFDFSEEADAWLTYTRRRLESDYLAIIQRLYHYERISGKRENAIQWLHRALKIDPFNEEVNQLLLKTYLEDGRRAEARKQFEYYQKVTGQIFDAQLPADIAELKELIFEETEELSPQEAHPWPLRPSFNVPYVGQEQIQVQLGELYRKGGSVIVYGEAGAGKTRLAQELHNRIQPHPKLLLATCSANQMDVPFHPWIGLLRNNLTQADWLQLSSQLASILKIIFPELASLRQDLQPIPDVITARIRQELFEALSQVLQILSNKKPVMLFLDDVHWADESSCDFLHYLLKRSLFRSPNRILLMTARIEEPNPGLMKFLPSLPQRNLEQVYLEQLTNEQVADLSNYVLGSSPSEFVERITKDLGGNPFFILETFHAILDSPEKISLKKAANLPLTSNVQQLIQYRLQRLSPRAQEVLQIAAALGNHFEAAIVEQANANPTERFVQAMEELQNAHLIVDVRDGKRLWYAFVHEKIRESLLDELPALRTRLLHHKVALALEEKAQGKTDEISIPLAQHYEKAGEFSKSFDFWVQGASYAYSITSIQEAINAFNRAKLLIPLASNLEDKQLYELYTKWSGVAFNLDDAEQVEVLNQELLSLGRERDSDLLIGTAMDGLSDYCFASNQFERGYKFVDEALPFLQRAGHTYQLLTAQVNRGTFLYMLGKFTESREVLYKVLEQKTNDNDANTLKLNSNLYFQLGVLEALIGYPNRSLDLLKQAIEQRQIMPAPAEIMSIYVAMGLAYYLKSEFKTGYDMCLKAIEMGEQMEYKRMLGYAHAYGASNSHYSGLLDKAWDHAGQALYIGQTYGHHEITALAYRIMGITHLRLEDYETAIGYFRQGLQVAGEHFVALELMTQLGYSLASIGQVEEGLMYLTQAYQTSSQLKLGSISVFARSFLVFVQSRNGRLDSDLLEEIELALIDAKLRSMDRAAALLRTPFIRVNQRSDMFLKQLNESLQDASRLSDPLFELNVLRSLILHKKSQNIPWQGDVKHLHAVLDELTPHAQGMPFESAWQRLYDSMKEIEHA